MGERKRKEEKKERRREIKKGYESITLIITRGHTGVSVP